MNSTKIRRSFLLGLLLSAALALVALMPLLAAALADRDYYGLRSEAAVPRLKGYESKFEQGIRLVFFGYQACGTVCPAQITNLLQLHRRFDQDPVEFVFVTLDPDRDSAQALDATIQRLGANFRAVRPDSIQQAQNLAYAYGGTAAKVGTAQQYEFEHSAHIYVVTADWRRQLIYTSAELDLDKVEADIRLLMSRDSALQPK